MWTSLGNRYPVHGVAKSRTQLSIPFTFHFHALEKEMATHSSILAWEIHGQRSLVGYSPWGHKELDMTEQLNGSSSTLLLLTLHFFLLHLGL